MRYQKEYPFYLKTTLEKINIDFEEQDSYPEEMETFQIGEKINAMIENVLMSGMKSGDLRANFQNMIKKPSQE